MATPGVYGMAGLVLELNRNYAVSVEVVPGVSATNAAASLVGAPPDARLRCREPERFAHPVEVIEKRIRCAADADFFVIALYNPKSRKRVEHIVRGKGDYRGIQAGQDAGGHCDRCLQERSIGGHLRSE